MVNGKLFDEVMADVQRHCNAKGYREGPGVNNFVPHDAVAAFGMAKALVAIGFGHSLAIAPEGHIYGYFFERLGIPVLSLFTDYPPTRCAGEDDLCGIEDQRVLLIEDDIVSGFTLKLVVEHLRRFLPRSLALYLGHSKGVQHLNNVPGDIERVYLADELLSGVNRELLEKQFQEFFEGIAN
jgi:hypothetical protein